MSQDQSFLRPITPLGSQGFNPITPIPNIQNNSLGFNQNSFLDTPTNNPIDIGFSGKNFGFGDVTKPPGTEPGFFDEYGGSRFIIPGLEAFTGLAGLSLARDQINLGKDQFAFGKAQSNRDFNSQAQVFNSNLTDAKGARLQNSGQFDTSTPEGQAAFDAALNQYVEQNKVNTVNL